MESHLCLKYQRKLFKLQTKQLWENIKLTEEKLISKKVISKAKLITRKQIIWRFVQISFAFIVTNQTSAFTVSLCSYAAWSFICDAWLLFAFLVQASHVVGFLRYTPPLANEFLSESSVTGTKPTHARDLCQILWQYQNTDSPWDHPHKSHVQYMPTECPLSKFLLKSSQKNVFHRQSYNMAACWHSLKCSSQYPF